MDMKAIVKWSKTALIAATGGGVTSAFAAAMDPTKYRFPHDFGSGKLWKFFFDGFALMFVGLLIKSPLGQKAVAGFQQAQAQAKEDAAMLDKVKSDITENAVAMRPPSGPMPPSTK